MLCACSTELGTDSELGVDHDASSLTRTQRRTRAGQIRDAARGRGLRAGWLLAGIADAETQMSHCWSELTWACRGPVSADCGGGPVVAGAGDGPCSLREGGLGMFQFDGGNFEETLARDGRDILTIAGNVRRAVDFVLDMVVNSTYVPGVSTRAQAIAWLDGVRVDNDRFDPWVRTVTRYYNGCQPGWSCWSQRYAHYRDNATGVWSEMGGAAFWLEGGEPTPVALAPIEVYWSRGSDGVYALRALAPASVARVVYRVDGWTIASASRGESGNFPASYRFSSETDERRFEVLGYDSGNAQVALGVGLIDVTDGTGVYIRQMGASLYEIGLERAPDEVASIEVRADGFVLTDSVSGATRSTRDAVRYRFTTLGERRIELTTYGADGRARGTLHRTVTLR